MADLLLLLLLSDHVQHTPHNVANSQLCKHDRQNRPGTGSSPFQHGYTIAIAERCAVQILSCSVGGSLCGLQSLQILPDRAVLLSAPTQCLMSGNTGACEVCCTQAPKLWCSPTGFAACSFVPTVRTSSMRLAASGCRCVVINSRMTSAVFFAQAKEPWICLWVAMGGSKVGRQLLIDPVPQLSIQDPCAIPSSQLRAILLH